MHAYALDKTWGPDMGCGLELESAVGKIFPHTQWKQPYVTEAAQRD